MHLLSSTTDVFWADMWSAVATSKAFGGHRFGIGRLGLVEPKRRRRCVMSLHQSASRDLLPKPEERLRYGDIAANFFIAWIGRQLAPKLEVFRLAQGQAAKQQTGLSRRPTVPCLNIWRKRPLRFVI